MAIIKNHILILLAILAIGIFLRFHNLANNPPGLYWDETVFGYDAYSILKTGKDHHGRFLPIFFESFGDWKLPVYHYLQVPSIALFGLNEFAVRFPSAFFGVLTIPLVFLIIKKLTGNINLSLLSAFFIAISPWNIQFSRGGFESNPGLFFLLSGLYLFLLTQQKYKPILFLSSLFLFALSMYTYHAYRIFTPLLIFILICLYKKQILNNFKKKLAPVLFFFILLIPLISFTLTSGGQSRAISQSAFKKTEFEQAKLDYDQKSKKPLRFLSSNIFNQPTYYSYVAIKGYLDNFSPVFLFFRGDQIGRHSQVDMGQLYSFQIILIVIGLFSLKIMPKQVRKILIIFLILSPIPSIIVTPTPHAYRTLQMTFPLALLSALGAFRLFSVKNQPLRISLLMLMVFSLFSFSHLMFTHYPKKFSADWQIGYKDMVHQIQNFQDNYEKVYVTNINQVPYIYLLFFQKYDPLAFINENGTVDHFNKYFFIDEDENIYDKGKILYVAPSWKKVDGKWLSAVNDNTGHHLYSLWEVGN